MSDKLILEKVIRNIGNRYELILIAAHRAKTLEFGAKSTVTMESNRKSTIVALHEISADSINIQSLKKHLAQQIDNTLKITEQYTENIVQEETTEGSTTYQDEYSELLD